MYHFFLLDVLFYSLSFSEIPSYFYLHIQVFFLSHFSISKKDLSLLGSGSGLALPSLRNSSLIELVEVPIWPVVLVSLQSFKNLIWQVTFHYFCHILLFIHTNIHTVWQSNTKGCEFQKAGITEGLLGGCLL